MGSGSTDAARKEEKKIYGYARVSCSQQNEARQLAAMEEFGIPAEHIYLDRQSGKDFNRQQYWRLLGKLRPGDLLVLKSIDRLGRNYREILEQWRFICREKKADVVVLDMPLLDTRKERDLTSALIADITLQLLSYLAEQERMFIRQRQAEGIAAALARGVKFGRKKKKRPENLPEIKERWLRGELSARAASRQLGISHGTFARWMKENE